MTVTTVLYVRVSESVHAELSAVAADCGLSMSRTLEALLSGRLGIPNPLTPVVARAITVRKKTQA